MNIIIFIAIYLPIQEFLLKWIPVGDGVLFLLRQAPDLLLFAFFTILVVKHLVGNWTIRRLGSGLDVYIVAFIVWSITISIITTGSSVLVNTTEIYTLLRYSVLIYCVQLLEPTEEQVAKLLKWLLVSVLLQVLVGTVQFVGGIQVRDFLAAHNYVNTVSDVERIFTGARDDVSNRLMGTMGDNINFAYLMAVGLFVSIATFDKKSVKGVVLAIIVLFMLFLSGSRAIFISTLIVYALYLLWVKSVSLRVVFAALFIFFSALIFTVMQSLAASVEYEYTSFLALFSPEILVNLMNQRLGLLIYFLPELILHGDIFFGHSPDRFYIAEVARQEYDNVPAIILSVFDKVFEDVYWLALVSYYGVVGAFFWIIWLFRLGWFIRPLLTFEGAVKKIGLIAVALLILSIPFNMANQAFESRYFSFYLWLFVGLAVAEMKKQQKLLTPKFMREE